MYSSHTVSNRNYRHTNHCHLKSHRALTGRCRYQFLVSASCWDRAAFMSIWSADPSWKGIYTPSMFICIWPSEITWIPQMRLLSISITLYDISGNRLHIHPTPPWGRPTRTVSGSTLDLKWVQQRCDLYFEHTLEMSHGFSQCSHIKTISQLSINANELFSP